MKKNYISFFLLFLLLIGLINKDIKYVLAESYQSHGEIEFYSDVTEKEIKNEINNSVSKMKVLPKTGEKKEILYSVIGIIILLVVIFLIGKNKRKEDVKE